MSDKIKDIRISDQYVKSLVTAEQARRGDATPTLTAGRMIIERDTQLQAKRDQDAAARSRRKMPA